MHFLQLSLSLVCLGTTAVVNAAPFTLGKRAISQDLYNQLSFFEQYSAAAYCTNNNDMAANTPITCAAGNCPLVQAADATSILEFENQGPGDSTGFLALDHTNKLIVLSFRGTTSFQNILADINLIMVPWSICPLCTAHAGFLSSWTAVKPQVLIALSSAISANPTYKLVATGHSLGAAIATLAAADLRHNSGYAVSLYTYGSPMVGNYFLATFITQQTSQNFRVTHADDIVPKLPGYPIFAHVSPEYWITSGDNVAVTPGDIQVSSGVIDLQGNQGQVDNSVDDHLWYFNAISACSPGLGSS